MNDAMFGAFSIALSRSGMTELVAQKLFERIGGQVSQRQVFWFKYSPIGPILILPLLAAGWIAGIMVL